MHVSPGHMPGNDGPELPRLAPRVWVLLDHAARHCQLCVPSLTLEVTDLSCLMQFPGFEAPCTAVCTKDLAPQWGLQT